MKPTTRRAATVLLAAPIVAALLVPALFVAPTLAQQEGGSLFAKPTIDLGVVVTDIDKSVDFYTRVVGMTATGGFAVDGDFARRGGLTDGKPLDIRVLTLGNGPGATSFKLMQVPGGKLADHTNIHATYGYSYITLSVTSMDRSVARARAAGASPIAEGPLEIPGANGLQLAILRDPDGNLVELVGPR